MGRKIGFVLGVLIYPRKGSSVPRSAIPVGLSQLLTVDRRLLGLEKAWEDVSSGLLICYWALN